MEFILEDADLGAEELREIIEEELRRNYQKFIQVCMNFLLDFFRSDSSQKNAKSFAISGNFAANISRGAFEICTCPFSLFRRP